MDAPVLEVAIGMVFTFAVVAALSAVLSELIARFLGLRARFLLLGLRELLDGKDDVTVALAQAETTFNQFRSLAVPPTAWARWAKDAAKQAPHIADWQAWKATATRQAKPLAPATSAEKLTAWADAASAAAVHEQVKHAPDWDTWAEAQADAGRHLTTSGGQPASATGAVMGASIMRTQGMPGSIKTRTVTIEPKKSGAQLSPIDVGGWKAWLGRNPLRQLPSYIPARTFSAAVFDLIIPDADHKTTLTQIRANVAQIEQFPALTEPLQSLLKQSEDSVEKFREAVEAWYDNHMDRVSGWYKRHIAKWSLAVGVILVLALNVNSIGIATTLFSDQQMRTAVAAIATDATHCDEKDGVALTECLDSYRQQLLDAQKAGLPIGWKVVTPCQAEDANCDIFARYGLVTPTEGWFGSWQPVLALLGWLITVVALVPGARFWFDLLAKMGSLRTTGPKPAETQD